MYKVFVLKVIDVHNMDQNYEIALNSIIPIILQVNYCILFIYTIYWDRHDTFKALKVISFLSYFVSATQNAGDIAESIDFDSFISLIDVVVPSLCIKKRLEHVMCDDILMLLVKLSSADEKEVLESVILPFLESDLRMILNLIIADQTIMFDGGVFIVPKLEAVTKILGYNFFVTVEVIQNTLVEVNDLLETEQKLENTLICHHQNIVLYILDFVRFVIRF